MSRQKASFWVICVLGPKRRCLTHLTLDLDTVRERVLSKAVFFVAFLAAVNILYVCELVHEDKLSMAMMAKSFAAVNYVTFENIHGVRERTTKGSALGTSTAITERLCELYKPMYSSERIGPSLWLNCDRDSLHMYLKSSLRWLHEAYRNFEFM